MSAILRSTLSGKSLLTVAFFVFAFLFAALDFAAAQTTATFSGEITDQHLNCVQNPVKAPPGVTGKADCVLYYAHFAQPPSKYVLYNAANKMAYQLNDQVWAQPYVGEAVEITGTLDPATHTITIKSIKELQPPS